MGPGAEASCHAPVMALFNHATAPHPQDCPLLVGDNAALQELPFKLRVEYAGALTATAGLFPSHAYLYHAARLVLYLASSASVCLAFPAALPWAEAESALLPSGFVRLTAWTALLEICGFCNLTGPLGAGQPTLAPLWYRVTAGTLKQPLLPGLARQRGCLDVGLFVLYAASAVAVVLSSEDHVHDPRRVRVAASLLTALCVLDRSAYTGSCGAYYYPLLVCHAFGGKGGLLGCRLVQLAHLFMAGVGKLGPWFRNVTPNMVGVCPWVPIRVKEALFSKGPRGQLQLLTPSRLSDCLSRTAVMLELLCPVLMASSSTHFRLLAVGLVVALHLYVVLQFAPGAVGEWNAFNAAATVYLFGVDGQLWPPTEDDESACMPRCALLLFVVIAVYIAPLVGNWRPDWLGNHFTLRKYTGNHPYHTFLVRRSAAAKLGHFRTFAPLAVAAPATPGAELLSCAALHSLVRGRLNLRRLLDVLAVAVPKGEGAMLADFARFDLGFIFSQNLLDATFLDAGLLGTMRDGAGFLPGELLSLRIASFPTLMFWPHKAPWELLDVGAGQRLCGGFVYADETFTVEDAAACSLEAAATCDAASDPRALPTVTSLPSERGT